MAPLPLNSLFPAKSKGSEFLRAARGHHCLGLGTTFPQPPHGVVWSVLRSAIAARQFLRGDVIVCLLFSCFSRFHSLSLWGHLRLGVLLVEGDRAGQRVLAPYRSMEQRKIFSAIELCGGRLVRLTGDTSSRGGRASNEVGRR